MKNFRDYLIIPVIISLAITVYGFHVAKPDIILFGLLSLVATFNAVIKNKGFESFMAFWSAFTFTCLVLLFSLTVFGGIMATDNPTVITFWNNEGERIGLSAVLTVLLVIGSFRIKKILGTNLECVPVK